MADLSAGFKEVITAALAFIIVLTAMFLLFTSLYPTFNLDNAKGVLTIFGGWVGLAIGYYFGRVPAEKGADKANEVADNARKQATKAIADRASAATLLEEHGKQLLNMKSQIKGPAPGGIDDMIDSINKKVAVMRTEI